MKKLVKDGRMSIFMSKLNGRGIVTIEAIVYN
jgi:hypothetical protein